MVSGFKKYLFQVADGGFDNSTYMNGKYLEEQEKLFRQKVVGSKKALLVLDLDNTILHSIELFKINSELLKTITEFMIIPPEEDTFIEKSCVKIRPYFEDFLKVIMPLYEIFIYTKGTRLYA